MLLTKGAGGWLSRVNIPLREGGCFFRHMRNHCSILSPRDDDDDGRGASASFQLLGGSSSCWLHTFQGAASKPRSPVYLQHSREFQGKMVQGHLQALMSFRLWRPSRPLLKVGGALSRCSTGGRRRLPDFRIILYFYLLLVDSHPSLVYHCDGRADVIRPHAHLGQRSATPPHPCRPWTKKKAILLPLPGGVWSVGGAGCLFLQEWVLFSCCQGKMLCYKNTNVLNTVRVWSWINW